MDIRTHQGMNARLCGAPRALAQGSAEVALTASAEMAADDSGLVHGGFVFGLADHAAMLAINEPTVVLGAAEVRFLAPARVGDTLIAQARELPPSGKKRLVEAHVEVDGKPVFTGTFTCFVPAEHVLAGSSPNAQKHEAP